MAGGGRSRDRRQPDVPAAGPVGLGKVIGLTGFARTSRIRLEQGVEKPWESQNGYRQAFNTLRKNLLPS